MLHKKFLGNQPTGSREEVFKGFLPYMDMATTTTTPENGYTIITYEPSAQVS